MATANRTFRSNMLLSTAIAALAATPGAVKAQAVNNVDVDLNSAFDPGGAGGLVGAGADTVLGLANDPGLTNSATLTVKAPVVVANWNKFNVLTGTVLNVTNDSGAATSTLVNRVIGSTASNISGTINSTNVNFWLINQNGIAFGSGARVNMTGASFLASTLDVDLKTADPATVAARFTTGATLDFSTGIGGALTTAPLADPLNIEFRSDGSMMFLSPNLNLNATFDAGGQIAFVTGADVDVGFTPGSPLTFTVQAGTTVARGQTVGGSVKGKSVVFHMATAAGIANALLRVNARVEATEAVATQSGIKLIAGFDRSPTDTPAGTPMGAPVGVALGNEWTTGGGAVSVDATGNLTASNPITGGSVSISTHGSAAVNNLTATSGDIAVNSRDLTVRTGVLSATGGDVVLRAPGDISTLQITARRLRGNGGGIDIESTTGRLALSGVLDAQGPVALDAPGSIIGAGIVTTGAVSIGGTTAPSLIRMTGDISAASIDARTPGGFNSTALTASTGNISVVANSIVTTAIDSRLGDVLLEATGGGIKTNAVSAGPRSPLTGKLTIRNLAGGAVNLGDLAAGSDITIDTTGTLVAGGATSTTGTLTVGATNAPARITFNGDIAAQGVTIDTTGNFTGQAISTRAGNLDIEANQIATGEISVTGGDALLKAALAVRTGDVRARRFGGVGGAIDIDSTGGGVLVLGNLRSDGATTLDTTAAITVTSALASGLLRVGSAVVTPTKVTFTGNATGQSVSIFTSGTFLGDGVVGTAGSVELTANAITAGIVRATGGDVLLTAARSITTGNIIANRVAGTGGLVEIKSTGAAPTIGNLALGTIAADGDVTLEAGGTIGATGIRSLGVLTVGSATTRAVNLTGSASAAEISIETVGAFTGLDLTTSDGSILVMARSINAGAVRASKGTVSLFATKNITTGLIAATATPLFGGAILIDSSDGGTINLGNLVADTSVFADTAGDLTTGNITAKGGGVYLGLTTPTAVRRTVSVGDVRGQEVFVEALGQFRAGSVTATTGDVDIAADAITTGAITSTTADVILLGIKDVRTGAIRAGRDVTANTRGILVTGAVTAARTLAVGAIEAPRSVTFGGDVRAGNITVESVGEFLVGERDMSGALVRQDDMTATSGSIVVSAGAVTGGLFTATGGDIQLVADDEILTTGLTARANSGGVGGAIDVESLDGGLDLGTLFATGNIKLNADGAIKTLGVRAPSGSLTVGVRSSPVPAIVPDSVTFGGDVLARSIEVLTSGAFQSVALTSSAGDTKVDAKSIQTTTIRATGGDVALTALQAIGTEGITGTGSVTVKSTGTLANVGAVTLGDVSGVTGITIDGNGAITTGKLTSTGGDIKAGGNSAATGITFGGDASAKTITARTLGGAFTSKNLTSTAGDIKVDAKTITAQVLAAAGDVALTALQAIGTEGITGTGSVTAKSTGTRDDVGAVTLGDVSGVTGITLDGNGAITTGELKSTGGDIKVGLASAATGITFGKDATAKSITARTATGAFKSANLTSTAGSITVDAKAITAGVLTATGGMIDLEADDNILTTGLTARANSAGAGGAIDVESLGGGLDLGTLNAAANIKLNADGAIKTLGVTTRGGSLTVGVGSSPAPEIVPDSVTFGDAVLARSIQVLTSGAFQSVALTSSAGDIKVDAKSIRTSTIDATGGDVALTALQAIRTEGITGTGSVTAKSTGTRDDAGAVTLGDVSGVTGITLDGNGAITTGKLTSTGGDLKVGLTSAATGITFGGDATAKTITARTATGAFTSANLTSTAGDIKVDARKITAGVLTATGGMIDLEADDNILTTGLTARANSAGAGGAIDVESLGGGLDLGPLNAAANIKLNADGAIKTLGVTTRGGSLTVGVGSSPVPAIVPDSVTFGGAVLAQRVEVLTAGAFQSVALTSSAGDIKVDAKSIRTSTIDATGGDVALTALQAIRTDGITGTGSVTAKSTGTRDDAGAVALGDVSGVTGITIDGNGAITTGKLTSTGGDIKVGLASAATGITFGKDATAKSIAARTLSGEFKSANLTSTAGGITVDAKKITAEVLGATGGNVALTALQAIGTGMITASGTVTAKSTGTGTDAGNIVLGDVSGTLGITLDGNGAITTGELKSTGGDIKAGLASAATSISFGKDATAKSITALTSGGAFTSKNLTSTAGDTKVDAKSIQTATIDATGGNVALTALQAIGTGMITATGSVTAKSTGTGIDAGAVALGDVSGVTGITLDGNGAITTGKLTSTGGDIKAGGNSAATGITFGGDATAKTITALTSGGAFTSKNLTSTAGNIKVDAKSIQTTAIGATGGNVALTALQAIGTGAVSATGTVTATSTGTGADAGAVALGDVSGTTGVTIDGNAAITTGKLTATGGDLKVGLASAATGITFGGDATAKAIAARTLSGEFKAANLTSTAGGITVDARNVSITGATGATGGDVRIAAIGDIISGAITATRVGGAGGTIDLESTGTGANAGMLNLGALLADLGIELDAKGAIATGTLTAKGGAIDLDGASIAITGASMATGGDVKLLATGNITTGTLSTNRAIDIDSSSAGALNLGAMTATGAIMLDTLGTVDTVAVTAGGNLVVGAERQTARITLGGPVQAANVNLRSSGPAIANAISVGTGSVAVNAATINLNGAVTAGSMTLRSSGATTANAITLGTGSLTVDAATINLNGTVAAGSATLRSSGATTANTITLGTGSLTVDAATINLNGAVTAGTVTLRSSGATTANAISLGTGSLTVDAATINLNGTVTAGTVTLRSSGLTTANQIRAENGTILIEAPNIDLLGAVTARNVTLKSLNNGTIGLGSAAGTMALSDAELGRINATNLLINAGSGNVGIAGVTFTDAAGRSKVDIATTGTIAITGNLSGTGAARTFRLGGAVDGTGVASRIIANIDTAAINLGTAALELRGTDIVFGQGALIQRVFGNTSPANVATGQGTRLPLDELVRQFVANAQSILYTPEGLAADKVGKPFLIAGKMSVTYGGSALFQNSAARTGGIAFEGVKLADAQNPAEPALVLNPLATPTVGADARIGDGNVFSIFGTVNGKEGPAAALAGETVIRVNDKLLEPASRINGCIIGSAAGCVTTIIGNFVLSVPREVIAPIVAEEGSPLPFDPLVGTNNESLFSDAAPQTGDSEACRQRDANGVCVGN